MKYLFLLLLVPFIAHADLVRSLKSHKVNLRTGPGERFPIEWVYLKKKMPVKVLDSFEHWRKIEDWQGTQGWVHKNFLNKQNTVITQVRQHLYLKPDDTSPILAFVEADVIGQKLNCGDYYCRIKFGEVTGYAKKTGLFGIEDEEEEE